MELFKQIKLPRLPHRCASLQSISSSFFSFFHIFNGFPESKIGINCFVLNRCRAPGCLIIKKIDRKSLSP